MLSKYLSNQKGAIHFLVLVAAIGLVAFIVISNTASFKDRLFGSLYPKQESKAAQTWALHNANPIISSNRLPSGLPSSITSLPFFIINDPMVIKEGTNYIMWVGAGVDAHGVAIYRFTSTNGTDWAATNGGNPVLTPGNQANGDFDWSGVETPSVVKLGSTYHMYYTSYKDGDPNYAIMGHATSPDGINWTKMGELLSLTDIVGAENATGNPWGWVARAEPTAVVVDNSIVLYFTDVKCRLNDCSSSPTSPIAIRGISVASSVDGHNFTQIGNAPVLLQTNTYPATQGYEGYSTPYVLASATGIDLYVDVFKQVDGKAKQVALARYTSTDAITFTESDPNIVVLGQQSWFSKDLRAPAVIQDGTQLKMWFAGDSIDDANPTNDQLRNAGIGYAISPAPVVDKKIFVTSATYNGNLGGLAGADSKCQTLASAAGLPGTYKAWLSAGATSAASRLSQNNGPYKRVNGTVVANSWADLTDGTLNAPINMTQTGASVTGYVWTDTQSNGNVKSVTNHCGSWTVSTSGIGQIGNASVSSSGAWTDNAGQGCMVQGRLYCLQQ